MVAIGGDNAFEHDVIARHVDGQVAAVEIAEVAQFGFDRGFLHRYTVVMSEGERSGRLKSAQKHWLCFQHERQMNELLSCVNVPAVSHISADRCQKSVERSGDGIICPSCNPAESAAQVNDVCMAVLR